MRSTLFLCAIGSLVFSGVTSAKPLRSSIKVRAVPVTGYDYAGCFTEATFGRALSSKTTYNNLMTTDLCASSCCFCGNYLAEGSTNVAEALFFFDYPGDSSQKCGAGSHLTIYALTGTLIPQVDVPAAFKSLGCYTEATTDRALAGASFADNTMTVAKCSAKCIGFVMFGVEYGRECFCGDTLSAGSIKVFETDCSFPCSGDSESQCGGAARLNLYTTGVEGETPDAPSSDYAHEGCYTDSVANRALQGKMIVLDDLTIDKCSTACFGFRFFGLEYGKECFCANTIGVSGQLAYIHDCNFPCSGDANQNCGAGQRLNLYKFVAASQSAVSSTTVTAIEPVITTSTTTVEPEIITSTTTTITPVLTTTSSTTEVSVTITTSATTSTTTEEQDTTTTTTTISDVPTTTSSTTSDTPTTTSSTTTTFDPETSTTSSIATTTTPEPMTTTTSQPTTTSSDVVTTTTSTTTTTTDDPVLSTTSPSPSTTTTTSTTTTSRTIGHNTPLPFPDPCGALPYGNLISNPGFEETLLPGGINPSWTNTSSIDNPHQAYFETISLSDDIAPGPLCGNKAGRLSSGVLDPTYPSNYVVLEQQIEGFTTGDRYRFITHVAQTEGTDYCTINVYLTAPGIHYSDLRMSLSFDGNGDQWRRFFVDFTALGPSAQLAIYASCSGGEEYPYVDQISISPLRTFLNVCEAYPNGNLILNSGFEDESIPAGGLPPLWRVKPETIYPAEGPSADTYTPSMSEGGPLCGTKVLRIRGPTNIPSSSSTYIVIQHDFENLILGQKYHIGLSARLGNSGTGECAPDNCKVHLDTYVPSTLAWQGQYIGSTPAVADKWNELSGFWVATDTTATLEMSFYCLGSADVYVDQLSVEPYYDSDWT